MDLLKFKSSNVQGGSYDASTQILFLAFGDTPDSEDLSVYQYHNIPESIWRELKTSNSKGRFVSRNIRGIFTDFERIDTTVTFVTQFHIPMHDWAVKIESLEGEHGWF